MTSDTLPTFDDAMLLMRSDEGRAYSRDECVLAVRDAMLERFSEPEESCEEREAVAHAYADLRGRRVG